ncbi:MAG TPA: DUF2760 domain-containing protein [Pseudomonadales bacterium]|nr:DUF2760 domain-containing protein [Pseudomonadales bacterium]
MEFVAVPTQIDGAHVALAALFLICLIIAVTRKGGKSEAAAPAPVVAPQPAPAPAPAVKLTEHDSAAALQLLGLLQQEARLIDFLNEELSGFSDADIGAAARVVHEGGKKVLKQYFTLAPVRSEAEESRVTIPAGFNPGEVRLTGNVTGQAPFTGTLLHRGWKATEVKLPKLAEGHDAHVIAPAEVEL